MDELLRRFELAADRPFGQLSTGNRRKVGIVQAVAHRPQLLRTAIGLAAAFAVGGYLIYSLLSLVEALAPLRFITPWYWYLQRNMLAHGVPPAAVTVPVLLSLALLAIGWLRFNRRDLR